jgi:hypothetical protein
MAKLPKKQVDVFDRNLDGVYGHFKTKDSFKLDYLLTSIRTEKLSYLETASEVLDLEMIKFEELVQRDIDYVRVHREIVGDYLKQGANRVIFFPPLMVTLIGIEKGHPIKHYTTVEATVEDSEFVTTYDRSRFQVRLNITEEETPHSISDGKRTFFYVNYAATLKYNSDKVRLVVLDGQHRLMALKRLMGGAGKDVVAGVDVPICVFFAPDARKAKHPNESLVDDMRELFVRINEEAKKVSGHFIWLLKDRSLAATAVRALGDIWKDLGGQHTFLHQLEWNQREHKLASQTTRPYSITTVSIVAEALEQFVFSGSVDQKNGYTFALLNLREVEKKLHTSPDSLATGYISEERFDADQLATLKCQIEKYVAPSLDVLFREPSPYKTVRSAFEAAVAQLDKEIESGKAGAAQFKIDVLCKFRNTNDLDQESVKGMEQIFRAMFENEDLKDVDLFRRNVFQQGLIRAWAKVFATLMNSKGITPPNAAKALIAALEIICFAKSKQYLSFYREYTQNVIYRGARIIVNDASKQSWRQLILATFINGQVRKEFFNSIKLQAKDKVSGDMALKTLGFEAAAEYLTAFQQRHIDHLKRNWRFLELKPEVKKFLEERVDSKDAEKIKQFQLRIGELSEKATEKAKDVLANVLGAKSTELVASVLGEQENDTEGNSE